MCGGLTTAIMNDGQVDETALAKALASTTMWMMPEYTEIEPQPTWNILVRLRTHQTVALVDSVNFLPSITGLQVVRFCMYLMDGIFPLKKNGKNYLNMY